MRFRVKVRPNSKEEKIERIGENGLAVHVKEPAREGKANAAVLRAVARHFGVPRSRVSIISGAASRTKIVEIVP